MAASRDGISCSFSLFPCDRHSDVVRCSEHPLARLWGCYSLFGPPTHSPFFSPSAEGHKDEKLMCKPPESHPLVTSVVTSMGLPEALFSILHKRSPFFLGKGMTGPLCTAASKWALCGRQGHRCGGVNWALQKTSALDHEPLLKLSAFSFVYTLI